jgi:hypothetical protein
MWSDGERRNVKEHITLKLEHKLDSLAPDVVLLLLGANDVIHGDDADADSVASNLRRMVRTINQTLPGVKILVANLVPNEKSAAIRTKTSKVNATIPPMVEALKKQGVAVSFVDMFSALKATDLADKIHPTGQGYAKMAERWFAGLKKAVPQDQTKLRRSQLVPLQGGQGAGGDNAAGSVRILANGRQLSTAQTASASLLWSVGARGQEGCGLLWR